MRNKLLILLFAYLGLSQLIFAQPHLSGTITINAKEGLIDCDFKLNNLPKIQNYSILLNHGMTIKAFSDSANKPYEYEGFYSGRTKGEAIEYFLMKTEEDTIKTLPTSFGIKYRGAFPIYDSNEVNVFDFKGFIAVNNKTIRATEQSKWYPVIYDAINDKLIDSYTFELTVISQNTKTVFINGCVPQQKTKAFFASTIPRQLFLFAGDYNVTQSNGNYILNAPISTETANKIFTQLDKIKAFHAANLGLSYKENIYIISHKAVKAMRKDQSWGFTIFPSFAYAGVDFNTLINEKGEFDNGNLAFFAHELSHYYFGSKMLSGSLSWFWLESTTEYLSLKTEQHFADTTFFNKRMRNYASIVTKANFTPLANIVKSEDINSDYRYVYGPLILFAFEKQFGEKATYAMLKNIIQLANTESLTIASWKKAAQSAGINNDAFNTFASTYINTEKAAANTTSAVAELLKW